MYLDEKGRAMTESYRAMGVALRTDPTEPAGFAGYRLLIVVDVLDGSAPSDIAARTRRRLGDVVRMEVLDDEHEGSDARRATESPEQRTQGHWLDA